MTHDEIRNAPAFAALSPAVRETIARNADLIDSLKQSALWYGWGRQDAAHDARIDVFAFADQYAALARRPEGRPSIQQAWADFVAALPVACIVVPGQDGPTLWDCECAECRHLQGAFDGVSVRDEYGLIIEPGSDPLA